MFRPMPSAPAPATGAVLVVTLMLMTGGLYGAAHASPSVADCLRLLGRGPDEIAEWLALAPCAEAGGDPEAASLRRSMIEALPADPAWYVKGISSLREGKRIAEALGLARLARLKDLDHPRLNRELAQVHLLASRHLDAARAYLRLIALEPGEARSLEHQLDQLLRQAASQIAPRLLLDSLLIGAPSTPPEVPGTLESLCWTFGHYRGAFESIRRRHRADTLSWEEISVPTQRFFALGYYDFAAALLGEFDWRSLPSLQRNMARALYYRVHSHLENWPLLIRDTLGTDWRRLSPELQFILAQALVREGGAEAAFAVIQAVEEAGHPPWDRQARLLRVRNHIRTGRFDRAEEELRAIKRDAHRQVGSGSLLFWQGVTALHRGRFADADSLFMQASAYPESEEGQRALEYRHWLMLDTSHSVRRAFFNGLDECPLPPGERLRSLRAVPAASPLWAHAGLERVSLHLAAGQPDSALVLLEQVGRTASGTVSSKARALAGFLLERRKNADESAVDKYRDLLLEYQQGVFPEFSRRRMRALKDSQ